MKLVLCWFLAMTVAGCDPSAPYDPFRNLPGPPPPTSAPSERPDADARASEPKARDGSGGSGGARVEPDAGKPDAVGAIPPAVVAPGAGGSVGSGGAPGAGGTQLPPAAGGTPPSTVDAGAPHGGAPPTPDEACPTSAAKCPDCGATFGPGCCAGDKCGCSPSPWMVGFAGCV